ncbi:hypothetical protein ACQ86G_24465 [Roseateles chitinivorans]|uniref:hypothetical protein n=1 Tax=Roseateles chitinivorans TaxID=2917965 RepID=UPI003D66B87E
MFITRSAMHPFDLHYIGQLAAAAVTPKGQQAAKASRLASQRIAAMRASDDPHQRVLGAGGIAGLGQAADPAKTGRILKPTHL